MVKYKTTIHQFGIISGIRRDTSDRLTVVTPSSLFSPEARKGQLLIITEATDEHSRGRDACQLVSKTISKIFYEDRSFSITSSLRKALREANSALYQYNFRAAPHQKTAVGVSCAVIRGPDLYLAQVQPTQAYVAHNGRLRALPTHPAWNPANISTTPFLPHNALGSSLFTEPDLRRNPIGPGDTLVFCSTNMSRLLGREEAERLFCYGDSASAMEALYAIIKRNSLPEACAIVVELMPLLSSEARDAPLSPAGVGERSKIAVRSVGEWFAGLTADATLLLRRPARSRQPEPALPELPLGGAAEREREEHKPEAPANDLSGNGAAPLEQSSPHPAAPTAATAGQSSAEPAPEEPLPVSALLGERMGQRPAQPQKKPVIDLSDHVPLPVDFAAIPKKQPLPPPPLRDRLTLPFRALLGMLVTFFALLLRRRRRPKIPDPPRFGENTGLSYRKKRKRVPWLPLLLLLSSIGLAVIYGQLKIMQTRQDNAKAALLLAEQALNAAENAASDDQALSQLQEVHESLAAAIQTGVVTDTDLELWPRYTQLRDQATGMENNLLQLSPLTDLEVVATLPATDTISKLVIDPNTEDIYALGEQSQIIYKVAADSGRPEPFFAEGTRAQQITAGPPQTFVWRLDAIVPIDRRIDNATIYLYNPAEPDNWLYNILQGSQTWHDKPIDVESFDANIYVWGAETGQILKYVNGFYADPPEHWIFDSGGQDLSGAVDMAVDGWIYLLLPNGEIIVLQQGAVKQRLQAPDVKPEIGVITHFFASGRGPGQGHFYLIEPAAERIIQVNKAQGELIQQLKAPEDGPALNQLRDIYVVDKPNLGAVMYLANGNQILRASVPAPPAGGKSRDEAPAPTPTVTVTP